LFLISWLILGIMIVILLDTLTVFIFTIFVAAVQVIWINDFVTIDQLCLFYVPAMVVVLSMLIFSYRALFGVFLGMCVSNIVTFQPVGFYQLLGMSLVPALAGAAALYISVRTNKNIRNFLGPAPLASAIDALDIFYICAIYATINSLIPLACRLFVSEIGLPVSLIQLAGTIFGNLSGAFLGFVCVNVGYSLFSRGFVRRR